MYGKSSNKSTRSDLPLLNFSRILESRLQSESMSSTYCTIQLSDISRRESLRRKEEDYRKRTAKLDTREQELKALEDRLLEREKQLEQKEAKLQNRVSEFQIKEKDIFHRRLGEKENIESPCKDVSM